MCFGTRAPWYSFVQQETCAGIAVARACAMQTTEVYLRADPMEKIKAIEGMTPLRLKRGRFTVPDQLIASLRASN